MEDRNTLLAALKLDKHSFTNQFMYVEEINNVDGSFILSAVIKYEIEKKRNVILVMCHNSLGHFQSLSQKLGYNLISLNESKRIYIIEVLEKVLNEDFLISKEPMKQLYSDVKNQLNVWGEEKGVSIIIENLGNLLLPEIENCFTFVNYLRALALERKDSSLLVSLHNFQDCPSFKFISKSMRHVADITITLRDLATGKANDVTGHLTVTRREEKYKKSTVEYQYQLQDRNICVFTPGSRNFV